MRISRTVWAAVVAVGTMAAAGGQVMAHSPGSSGSGMGPGMKNGGSMGPGMMRGGRTGQGMMRGGGNSQGMMRGGMMMHPVMMQRMMMMHGMMGGGLGPAVVYGMGTGAGQDLTVEDVKKYLGRLLEGHGNKRLKLGKVTQPDKDTIVAEIVTADNSLVQKLSIDRHNRTIRQVN